MLPGLDAKIAELKQKRKDRSMTQTELARKAGVSQSFVAKFEAGNASPGYERVRRLETALDESERTIEPYIEPVVSVEPDASGREVLRKVVEGGYVLVVRDGVQIGSILPPHILTYTAGGLRDRTAESLMDDPVPELSPHADEASLRSLLSGSPVVAVTEEGAITGAVTTGDVLRHHLEDI